MAIRVFAGIRFSAFRNREPKNDLRLPGENRRQQPVVFGRVQLEIRILDQQDIAGSVPDAVADRRAFAPVFGQRVDRDRVS